MHLGFEINRLSRPREPVLKINEKIVRYYAYLENHVQHIYARFTHSGTNKRSYRRKTPNSNYRLNLERNGFHLSAYS